MWRLCQVQNIQDSLDVCPLWLMLLKLTSIKPFFEFSVLPEKSVTKPGNVFDKMNMMFYRVTI